MRQAAVDRGLKEVNICTYLIHRLFCLLDLFYLALCFYGVVWAKGFPSAYTSQVNILCLGYGIARFMSLVQQFET